MMQTGGPDTADVHAGTLADRVESFQDRDVIALIFFGHQIG